MYGDVPDVRDGNTFFAQPSLLVVRLNSFAYLRPFGSLGTIEPVPDDGAERHRGERRVDVGWWRRRREL